MKISNTSVKIHVFQNVLFVKNPFANYVTQNIQVSARHLLEVLVNCIIGIQKRNKIYVLVYFNIFYKLMIYFLHLVMYNYHLFAFEMII